MRRGEPILGRTSAFTSRGTMLELVVEQCDGDPPGLGADGRLHQQSSNDLVAVVAGHRDFQQKLAEMRKAGKKPREMIEGG